MTPQKWPSRLRIDQAWRRSKPGRCYPARSGRHGQSIRSERLAIELLEPRYRLIDAIGLVMQVVVHSARDDENALLRGCLIEQFEPVTVGAKGAHLAAADNDLQRLGHQLLELQTRRYVNEHQLPSSYSQRQRHRSAYIFPGALRSLTRPHTIVVASAHHHLLPLPSSCHSKSPFKKLNTDRSVSYPEEPEHSQPRESHQTLISDRNFIFQLKIFSAMSTTFPA